MNLLFFALGGLALLRGVLEAFFLSTGLRRGKEVLAVTRILAMVVLGIWLILYGTGRFSALLLAASVLLTLLSLTLPGSRPRPGAGA